MSDRAVLSTEESTRLDWRAGGVEATPEHLPSRRRRDLRSRSACWPSPSFRACRTDRALYPSPTAAQSLDISELTTTFVSPTNGFSFKFFDEGSNRRGHDPVNQPVLDDSGALYIDPFDYVDTGFGAAFMGASKAIPDGVSIDAWVDDHVSPSGCGRPRSQQEEITIDGQSGRIFECPTDQIVAVEYTPTEYLVPDA
jgi:hypothetical protein